MCESGQEYPRGLLLLGHGSDESGVREEIETLSGQVKGLVSLPFVDVAYLERMEPSIGAGIERGLAAGMGEIVCAPVFLFTGADLKIKLPEALSPSQARYPNLALRVTPPFGADGRLVEVLLERMREQGFRRPQKEEQVILLGRGSNDPDHTEGMAELAEMLAERSGHEVRTAFHEAGSPNLAEAVDEAVASASQSILILPCLLFQGVILSRVKAEVETLRDRYPQAQLLLGGHLGPHPNLARIIAERVRDAV